jgi:aminopeptidase N
MRTETPHTIYLKDYAPPAWLIDMVELHVAIHDGHAEVRARLACRRNPANPQADVVLDGEELTLLEVGADGTAVAPSRYTVGDEALTLHGPLPDAFTLETLVRIDPDNNTQLSGLYKSRDGYFTQCEAQGFRRITFYPDRPDVMARFTCTIEADKQRFPQLLSNGNLVAREKQKETATGRAGKTRSPSRPISSRWSRRSWTCWRTASPRHRGARCASRCMSSRASSTSADTPWRR